LRGLALNFTSAHQVGNSAGISNVGENKQLLIASVPVAQLHFSINQVIFIKWKKQLRLKINSL
jgi:hypothetical protein